jgi:hypothetical protein
MSILLTLIFTMLVVVLVTQVGKGSDMPPGPDQTSGSLPDTASTTPQGSSSGCMFSFCIIQAAND